MIIKGRQQANDAIWKCPTDPSQPDIFVGLTLAGQSVQARFNPFDMPLG